MAFLTLLPRTGWTATGSTTWDAGYVASNLLDGNTSSDWHSGSSAVYPHYIILNLGSPQTFNVFRFRPRNDCRNPATSEVYVSDDGISWGTAIATASGWDGTAAEKDIVFSSSVTKQYLKFVGLTATPGAGNYMGAAEINLGLTFEPVYRPSVVAVPIIKDTRLKSNNVLMRCASSATISDGGGTTGDNINYGYIS